MTSDLERLRLAALTTPEATGATNDNCAEHNEVVTNTYNWFIPKTNRLNHDSELLGLFENISTLFQTNKFWIWDPLEAQKSPKVWMKYRTWFYLVRQVSPQKDFI